jgi:hypothetical protein
VINPVIVIVRSPAKVCWHVLCNGILIEPRPTKSSAEALKEELETILRR